MTRNSLLGVAVAFALISAGIAWVFSQLETEQITVTLPGSAEARANPLLAAERFLGGMGVEVASLPGTGRWIEEPRSSDTLLMHANRAALGQVRARRLLDWIAGGGHLIMDVEGLWDSRLKRSRSHLLMYFGVRLSEPESVDQDLEDSPIEVVFGEGDTRVSVAFRDTPVLLDRQGNSTGAVNAARGSLLLQFEHGDGRVTLVNDLGFLDNRHIGEHEHAYFLYLLAGQRGKIWLLYSPHYPSLPQLIWQHADRLLLTLLVLGVLWFRWGNLRIGPMLPPPPAASRDLTEHVDAIGRFEKQHGLLDLRLATTREIVERRWLNRHPQLDTMSHSARAVWIAKRLALDAQQVEQALYAEASSGQLSVETRLLQRLWHGA